MAYYTNTTVNQPHYANIIFDDYWGRQRPLEYAVTLDPEKTWLPTSGHLEKHRKKRMPDAIGRWEITLVSERLKDIVQAISPTSQQFFPFALRNGPSVDAETHSYFILNVTATVDCIISAPEGLKDQDGWPIVFDQLGTGGSGFTSAKGFQISRYAFCLDKSKIDPNVHLWRDPEHHKLFVSAELAKRLSKSPKKTGFEGKECLMLDASPDFSAS